MTTSPLGGLPNALDALAVLADRIEAFDARLDAIEARLDAVEARPDTPADPALEGRLDAIELALGTVEPPCMTCGALVLGPDLARHSEYHRRSGRRR